ncbi:hypothetical protein HUT18_20555 [Streptomyces sp. NA04227]|uniref:RbsD/FucU domain-containing protein n=1 Tax=Streptomyces sp. NA04227 TaxID=2742136 RepID=UPI00159159D0|nr:RbsD/FucU domain-containing protein [Streptomyces sp. NA04227]QKW08405.1 hypothetical protein HUT18_20555 [Streptomyces sp. NA04227]
MSLRTKLRPRHALVPVTAAAVTLGAFALAPGSSATQAQDHRSKAPKSVSWQKELRQALPTLGHRNWIVVADSAYPRQTSAGVRTLTTGADQTEVVKEVVAQLGKQQHVKAHVQVDKEMKYVPEKSAPGITSYRDGLDQVLKGQETEPVLHEELIKKLDEAGEKFQVIVLKTDLTLPYTSVFFELDAKYWDADREAELRELMKS